MKGLKPTPIDPQDSKFHFHKLFGVAASFADSYIVDNGKFPNQNADNRPSECTAYTIVDISANEDGMSYAEDYQYMKTLEIMDAAPDSDGADGRTAFQVPCTFGLLIRTLVPPIITASDETFAATPGNWPLALDTNAKENLKPAYLPIAAVPDYFDGIRSALVLSANEKRTVGMATQWSPSFESLQSDAVLPDNPISMYWGHMYEAVGWKQLYGNPYLILKTWQGTAYGDGGYCYMSRTLCNALMGTWGAYAASIEKLSPGTIDALKLQQSTFIEVAIALIQNLIGQLRYKLS